MCRVVFYATVNIEYTSFEYFKTSPTLAAVFSRSVVSFPLAPTVILGQFSVANRFFSCVCTLHFSRSTERTGAICIFSFEGGPRLSKGNTVVHNVARVRHEVLQIFTTHQVGTYEVDVCKFAVVRSRAPS